MRLMRPSHDPKTTPFVERLDDVRRIYLAPVEPLNVAYALGALAGLPSDPRNAGLSQELSVPGAPLGVQPGQRGLQRG